MNKKNLFIVNFILIFVLFSLNAFSLDTDIYKANVRPNVMILFDNSGSMGFGVYEHSIDYGAFYDWASEQGDCDVVAGGCGTNNAFYKNHENKNEILLVKGNIGVAIQNGHSFTGDPGDPDYIWYTNDIIHTNTGIDDNGNLYRIDDSKPQRITVNSNGVVLLDGEPLPLDRSIKLHNWQANPDGTFTDKGFGGLINAPGWYFSGFKSIGSDASDHVVAQNGDKDIYFFLSGNWMNMQQVYNLETQSGDRTWEVRSFPLNQSNGWNVVATDIHTNNYPNNYPNNEDETWTITQLDASYIKLHFKTFITEDEQNCDYDYLEIYRDSIKQSNLLDTMCGDKGSDFWSKTYTLGSSHKLILKFHSDYSVNYSGFKIDEYEYASASDFYKMQRRIDVVRDAIIYVINNTIGKINWGLATFNNGNGAKILQPLNPSLSDDQVRQNIITQLNLLTPGGGTPLGESLQDMYNHYKSKYNILPKCSKNYVIVISDGYPSDDNDWSRISGVTFKDFDDDGWTEDPYQYNNPPPDYMDDVAHWMYTHNFKDGSVVLDPDNAKDNIISDTLGFTLDAPIMKDTAKDGGGMYLTAFNKQQLVNALYSLGLVIISNVSYVAPVVSVDVKNKTQNGDSLYMAFFKPQNGRWTGNLKKYKLTYKIKSNSGRTEKEWVVTDKNGYDATDVDGNFLSTSTSFWSTESDGGDVDKGGAAEVLKNTVNNTPLNNPYSGRHIYVIKNDGSIVKFIPSNITNTDLAVDNDSERYKIINYIYGYTYGEDGSSNHYPVARRANVLGSIIHSSPTILSYENEDKTYIAIGANDGMLHVFDDSDGKEAAAFIPENLLKRLKELNPYSGKESPLFFVDGPISYYYTFDNEGHILPKILIFGERRGGRDYYALNIENSNPDSWTFKWHISDSGDFSELGQSWSKMKIVKIPTSSGSRAVAVFDGGYDTEEDKDSPGTDSMGRAIYVVDVNTGNKLYSYTYSINHNMKYCIPADPTIIPDKRGYLVSVLFSDIGGEVWKMDYDRSTMSFQAPKIVFNSNPGSNAVSGDTGGTLDSIDAGRKMFYSPDVTFMGNCNYITGSYYDYYMFVGTGDREHPLRNDINNRFYAILLSSDNSSLYPLDERNLLNVTDDELDVDSGASDSDKQDIKTKLKNSYGWYIKLGDIEQGEKSLSKPILFNKIVYFTTFTPILSDPCHPHGKAKVYALNYCIGTSGLDYNKNNDNGEVKYDKTDRSRIIGESIPSGVKIMMRNGKVGAFVTAGGKITGAGDNGSSKIPYPPEGINVIDWRKVFE